MSNQNNCNSSNLLARNVDIEPSGVFYNIRTTSVEEFVEDYFTRKGVDGVTAVKTLVNDHGKPYVSIYLFMRQDSKFIESDIQNVPPMLRNKIDKVNVRLKDEFKKILYPLCGPDIKSGRAEGREYFVHLNIFRVIGLMFAADPARHNLVISDAKNIPNSRDAIISVVKSERAVYGGSGGDKYRRMAESIEKR